MELHIQKASLRLFLNKLIRRTQRVEITTISNKVMTVRNVYKNKQIIEVSSILTNRCNCKI